MEARHATLYGPGFTLALTNRDTAGPEDSILEDVAGWFGGVGVEGDNTQRPLGHGLFVAPSRRGGRPLTLKGVLTYAEEADRNLAQRLLSGTLWDGELGSIVVDVGGLELEADVKLDGAPKLSELGDKAVRLEIPLLAPDPFLRGPNRIQQLHPAGVGEGLMWPLGNALDYGASARASSSTIRNEGNATSWPRFVVRGDFPGGWRISSGASSVEYPVPTFESSPVVVDMATGAITVEGRDRTYSATRRDWFGIPAQGGIAPKIVALTPGRGWADVEHHDLYI